MCKNKTESQSMEMMEIWPITPASVFGNVITQEYIIKFSSPMTIGSSSVL